MKKISGILMLLVYVCAATTLLDGKFVGASNMQNLARWSSLYAIIGMGVAFVIITGGIDLSIGSVIGMVGCLLPMLLNVTVEWGDASSVALTCLVFGTELLAGGLFWFLTRYDTRHGPRPQPLRPPLIVTGSGFGVMLLGAVAAWTQPPTWLAIVCALLVTIVFALHIGVFHGVLVTKMKVQPFVVTLCGLLFYRGFARYLTGDQPQGFGQRYNDSLRLIATGKPCSVALAVLVAGILVVLFCAWRLVRRSVDSTPMSRSMLRFGLVMGAVLALLGASRFGSGIEFEIGSWHVDWNPDQVPGGLLSWISWFVVPAFGWLLIRAVQAAGRSLAAPLATLVVMGLVLQAALWLAEMPDSQSWFGAAWGFRMRIAAVFGSLALFLGAVAWFANTALRHGRDATQLPLSVVAATAVAWMLSHKFGNVSLADTLIGQMQVPAPMFVMVVLGVVAAIFLNLTIYGRYLLALGRNEQAARFSGIETEGLVIAAYVICSGAAGVFGILYALDINSVQPSGHGSFLELYAIAAAVLGGCSLRGGEGSILGVVIGAAVMRVLTNSINILGIPTTLEQSVIGAVILLGVMTDEMVKRVTARRRALAEARAKAQ